MSRKGTPSLEDLSAVIAGIHDAGVDGVEWPAALARIGGLFDARSAAVWMQNPSGGFRDVRSLEQTAELTRDYVEHYGRLDTLRHAVMRAPVGTILRNAMVVPRSEFVRTEFYAGFADRYDMQDCMQARFFDTPGWNGYVTVARSYRVGDFEREDIRLLRLLLPHLRRAMQTQLRLASLGIERDSALEVLDRLRHGMLLVDAQARVIYANGAADAILRKGDGLGMEPASRRLRAAAPGQTGALRRLVARAADRGGDALSGAVGNGAIRLDRAIGVPLLLSVAPLRAEAAWNVSPRPAVLVLIGRPEDEEAPAPSAHLRSLYDLTPAEAAVAGCIAQGQGLKNAAEALGVAPSTVRWHLQHVFEKTGTTRQAELARLVERLGAVAGNGRG